MYQNVLIPVQRHVRIIWPLKHVHPTGISFPDQPAKMNIIEDTLTIRMQDRAVRLKAEVDADIPFKMWLVIGTDWGLLGCSPIAWPCWGALIYFRAKIELDILFGINWNEDTNKIVVKVNMPDTKFK